MLDTRCDHQLTHEFVQTGINDVILWPSVYRSRDGVTIKRIVRMTPTRNVTRVSHFLKHPLYY